MWENILEFIWWLWLFILWIFLFDESIKKLISQKFKNIIQKTTNTLFKSIWTWVLATTILQWSTAVLLIVVSFVAAWVIDFSSAVGIVLWANIWTPIVSVVLWNLGLRFSFSTLALPVIWLFSLLLFLCSKNKKLKNIFKLIVWLALLFLWLWYMNENMSMLSTYVDFAQLSSYSIFFFFLIWLFITVLTQSSSITIVLALTAANSWLIDYRIWIMLIIWSFLWTASTTLIWCVWGNYLKKQVAFSHLFFNIFSVIFWFISLNGFVRILEKLNVDIVLWLSIFAVWFKVLTVFILLFFLKPFVLFIQKLFPKKRTHLWLSIETTQANVVDASLLSVQKDEILLLKKVFKYILNIWSIDEKEILKISWIIDDYKPKETLYNKFYLDSLYSTIKEIEQSLALFQLEVKKYIIAEEQDNDFSKYQDTLSDIVSAAKYMKDVSGGIMNMQYSSNKWILSKYYWFRIKLSQLYKEVSLIIDWKNDDELLENIITLMETIKTNDEDFMEEFTWTVSGNWSDQTILSDSLHVNRYFYLSCLSLISALKRLFLSDEQRKLLEKIE